MPPENASYVVVKVFYGTDRARTGDTRPDEFYGSKEGSFDYGIAEVSIPKAHMMGGMERPVWYKLEFSEDPSKHIVLQDVTALAGDEFFRQMKASVSQASIRDVFVFIHGFNVTFADAVRRTGQLAFDLKFKGTPVAYSWPSQGRPWLTRYHSDEDSVSFTESHLRQFLLDLKSRTGAEKIHVLAHSMGNRALTKVLLDISRDFVSPAFSQIMLAAPDISAETFKNDIAPALKAAERVTLYASSKDEALKVSERVHGGHDRAGESGENIVLVRGLDTVDASDVDTGLLGHSYYDTIPLLMDISKLMESGAEPSKRNLAPKVKGQLPYWLLLSGGF